GPGREQVPVVRHDQPDWAGVLRTVREAVDTRGLTDTHRSALIFAGGRASRLGGVNKALLEVGGSTIVARLLAALGPLVDERVLLTNDAALADQEDVSLVF